MKNHFTPHLKPWFQKKSETFSDLNKIPYSFRKECREKTDELNINIKQLKREAEKHQKAEEQVHIRTKAMDATTDGIFIIDATNPNFPFIYANQSCCKMTGYTKNEILGKNYFLHTKPYVNPKNLDDIKHTLIQGKPFIGDMIQYRKNGEKYWNLLRITPVRDGNGTVTHYVGVKTDITFMKQKDLEIEDLHEENLHLTRVAELSEIVSSLAHEISQPLTAIHSYAQAAKRMLGDREPKTQEILQYIINDDQRATDVIRHLRSLLKKVKQVFEPHDINDLLNETIKFLADNIIARKAVLNIELDQNLPTIIGDRVQLQQVLLNLINNSLDAMEGCVDSRELLIRTSQKDINTIMVEVKDSGCGISAQSKEKLFTHFYTTKSRGLGMGLAISRSIIKAHGGQMDAKNNSDRGATFYFTIPVGIKEIL